MTKKPELLCPVGGKDTLSAALLGGADAVYFGAQEFNARMKAKNFDRPSLREAVAMCHEKGVRAYITLNTLLTDRQLPAALDLASYLYEIGADALIVADLGFADLVKRSFPDFELHASTQMSGHNLDAAKALAKRGFSRMVCARELDRENVCSLCKAAPIEIEMFVHGAICACHSGQCLMSSMIGDRSGNRGECAQPCRLPYNGSYPISFKDLSLASHAGELGKIGVSSLKIEGRMKSPEYVYTVSSVWRRLLDEERNATCREIEHLAGIFSRSGFTDGYYTGNLNGSMLGIRTDNDKNASVKTKVSFAPSFRKAEPITVQREKRAPLPVLLPPKEKAIFGRSARFQTAEQIPETDYFREIYLPLEAFSPPANGVVLPAVVTDSEKERVRALLEQAVQSGARHALVGNVGHFELLRGLDLKLHGDFRLNVTNSFTLASFPELSDCILSPELNLAQMRDLRGKKSTVVYGRIPLMLLEKRVGEKSLRDRKGAIFPILREGRRDVLVNSVPFYMLDREKELKEKGILSRHFFFTTETMSLVKEILAAAREKKTPDFGVKRIK